MKRSRLIDFGIKDACSIPSAELGPEESLICFLNDFESRFAVIRKGSNSEADADVHRFIEVARRCRKLVSLDRFSNSLCDFESLLARSYDISHVLLAPVASRLVSASNDLSNDVPDVAN